MLLHHATLCLHRARITVRVPKGAGEPLSGEHILSLAAFTSLGSSSHAVPRSPHTLKHHWGHQEAFAYVVCMYQYLSLQIQIMKHLCMNPPQNTNKPVYVERHFLMKNNYFPKQNIHRSGISLQLQISLMLRLIEGNLIANVWLSSTSFDMLLELKNMKKSCLRYILRKGRVFY